MKNVEKKYSQVRNRTGGANKQSKRVCVCVCVLVVVCVSLGVFVLEKRLKVNKRGHNIRGGWRIRHILPTKSTNLQFISSHSEEHSA